MLLADVLRNLGAVLAGTAAGLGVAVLVELRRRRHVTPAPPWPVLWQVRAVIVYACGLHIKAAAVNLTAFGDGTIGPQLVAFVALSVVGNVALLLTLQVVAARRLAAEQMAARIAQLRAELADEAPPGPAA